MACWRKGPAADWAGVGSHKSKQSKYALVASLALGWFKNTKSYLHSLGITFPHFPVPEVWEGHCQCEAYPQENDERGLWVD